MEQTQIQEIQKANIPVIDSKDMLIDIPPLFCATCERIHNAQTNMCRICKQQVCIYQIRYISYPTRIYTWPNAYKCSKLNHPWSNERRKCPLPTCGEEQKVDIIAGGTYGYTEAIPVCFQCKDVDLNVKF
jgi:hypothetical protein